MTLRMGVAAAMVMFMAGPALAVDIETVPVGNPGNADDTETEGYGAVAYTYNMGRYEVTAGQYTDFLNAVAATDTYGLYNITMWSHGAGCQIQRSGSSGSYTYSVAPDWADRPVNYVSWGDAARFCNWLENGQPVGMQDLTTTEDGSYYLNGATSDAALLSVTRKVGATWVIPSEDEWYKAAYHKNDGVTGNYFNYPTSSDSVPSNDLIDPDPGNNATFDSHTIGSPYFRTEVGAHENSESPYGTFDQGGNVWEWNEAVVYGSYRGLRGGSFTSHVNHLHASIRNYCYPSFGNNEIIGFRVAAVGEFVALTINYVNEPWGDVETDPEPMSASPPDHYYYSPNTPVELTATPIEGKAFRHWEIYDPNYPGDANHVTLDTNNPITIIMNADREVTAAFECGSSLGPMLPILLAVLGLFVWARRRGYSG